MQSLVGIFRTETDLRDAITRIAELNERWSRVRVGGGRAYNPGWNLVFELRNLLVVSEAIARSAEARSESRGAHSRLDFPDLDEATWGHRNNAVSINDGQMRVSATPLPPLRDELAALLTTP
jgi:succinate dehydrogenase / fumarate reductase flavoprotein subunit